MNQIQLEKGNELMKQIREIEEAIRQMGYSQFLVFLSPAEGHLHPYRLSNPVFEECKNLFLGHLQAELNCLKAEFNEL